MVSQIIADIHFLNLAVLVLAFHENVLKKVVIVLLHFFIRHVGHQVASIGGFSRVLGVHVKILQKTGLGKRWFIVDSRTPVSMAASSNLEVE